MFFTLAMIIVNSCLFCIKIFFFSFDICSIMYSALHVLTEYMGKTPLLIFRHKWRLCSLYHRKKSNYQWWQIVNMVVDVCSDLKATEPNAGASSAAGINKACIHSENHGDKDIYWFRKFTSFHLRKTKQLG